MTPRRPNDNDLGDDGDDDNDADGDDDDDDNYDEGGDVDDDGGSDVCGSKGRSRMQNSGDDDDDGNIGCCAAAGGGPEWMGGSCFASGKPAEQDKNFPSERSRKGSNIRTRTLHPNEGWAGGKHIP